MENQSDTKTMKLKAKQLFAENIFIEWKVDDRIT